jgi:hypothetical protein
MYLRPLMVLICSPSWSFDVIVGCGVVPAASRMDLHTPPEPHPRNFSGGIVSGYFDSTLPCFFISFFIKSSGRFVEYVF